MRRGRGHGTGDPVPGASLRALAEAVAQALADLLNEAAPGSVALAGIPVGGPIGGGPTGPRPARSWSPFGGPLGALRHDVDVSADLNSGDARTTGLHLPGRRPRPAPTAPGARPRPVPSPLPSAEGTDEPAALLLDPELPTPGIDPAGPFDEEPADGAVAAEHGEVWELVSRAQQGDGEAFGQLYDRYVDTVFRFIYFRVNDRGLAEDFTSETFLRALRRISTISYQGRDIGAWFVTIARNIVFDHMKSARHRLEVTTADTLEGDDRAPSTESAVMELMTNERLMAAVRQLGDEQRECVMLRFIQGFSVSEVAAVMGKNEGAIKALQHRAVRKLAEIVGDELR